MSVYGRMSDGQIRRLSECESLKSSEKDSRINALGWWGEAIYGFFFQHGADNGSMSAVA